VIFARSGLDANPLASAHSKRTGSRQVTIDAPRREAGDTSVSAIASMKDGGTLAYINATNASPPDCPGFPLTNEWAAASTASSEVLCIGGFFELDPEVNSLWFRFQPVSLKRINSIAILADARIPTQWNF